MPHPRLRTRLVALAGAALLCALAAGMVGVRTAQAATGVKYGLTDDAWLLNGPGTLDDRLGTLDTLGVGVVRFTLRWDQIAHAQPASPASPSDSAYDWADQARCSTGCGRTGSTSCSS
jgi:hypothetical protein